MCLVFFILTITFGKISRFAVFVCLNPGLCLNGFFSRQYSVSGENFTKSFMITHRKSFGNYSFIAMDACPSPGPKRPLNFFGVVTSVWNKMHIL